MSVVSLGRSEVDTKRNKQRNIFCSYSVVLPYPYLYPIFIKYKSSLLLLLKPLLNSIIVPMTPAFVLTPSVPLPDPFSLPLSPSLSFSHPLILSPPLPPSISFSGLQRMGTKSTPLLKGGINTPASEVLKVLKYIGKARISCRAVQSVVLPCCDVT